MSCYITRVVCTQRLQLPTPNYEVQRKDGMHHAVLTNDLWGSIEGVANKKKDAISDCALNVCRVLHRKGRHTSRAMQRGEQVSCLRTVGTQEH